MKYPSTLELSMFVVLAIAVASPVAAQTYWNPYTYYPTTASYPAYDQQQYLAQLQNTVQQLQAQIAATTYSYNSYVPTTYASDYAGSFWRDLRIGSRGEDVRALQRYLNNQGMLVASYGAGAPGYETDYFGYATSLALSRFQSSRGLQPTGLLDAMTRQVIAGGSQAAYGYTPGATLSGYSVYANQPYYASQPYTSYPQYYPTYASNNNYYYPGGQPCGYSTIYIPCATTGSATPNAIQVYRSPNQSYFGLYSRNSLQVRIGSYQLIAPSDRDISLTNLTVQLGSGGNQFANLFVRVNGQQYGITHSALANYTLYGFSGSTYIARGNFATIDVFADVLSSATTGSYDSLTSLFDCNASATNWYSYSGTQSTNLRCTNVTGQIVGISN